MGNINVYRLPGGGLENDEDPEAAFLREITEETGCEVEIVKELGIIEEHKSRDNFKQISYVFVSKVINDTKQLHLTNDEKDLGAKPLWVDVHNALELIENSYEKLVSSKYEDIYFAKFALIRDKEILQYHLNNK